jgi:DNA adenine methylase
MALDTDAQRLLFPREILRSGKPLVKWAGGKSGLLPTLKKLLPRTFNRYAEAFAGGAALFFDLALPDSMICDTNPELIHFYCIVRDHPEELFAAVQTMRISERDYYEVRQRDPESLDRIERAARFIYLNKTCFNGLYRVNKKGRFNTPFGKRTDVTIVNKQDLLRASDILRKAEIVCADYTAILPRLRPGDFVYLDPPYLPLGGYSDFNRYTRDFFTEEDHVRLAGEYRTLTDRGVMALLSNSYHERILSLYQDFEVIVVTASRQINCDPTGRGEIKEVIVANYPVEVPERISANKIHGQQAGGT